MDARALQEALGTTVIGIDHLTVAVRDLDSSIRWYETALGFRVQDRRNTRGGHSSMRSAVMTAGSAVMVLVEGGEPDSQVSRFIEARGEGISHVALAVTDLDGALQRIAGVAGVKSLPEVPGEGIRQAFLERDAQTGVRLELIERRGGKFSDASMAAMFRVLEERSEY
jgi:methylmalonyl-CoA epimerase